MWFTKCRLKWLNSKAKMPSTRERETPSLPLHVLWTFLWISRGGILDLGVSSHSCDPGFLFVYLPKDQGPPRQPNPQLCLQARPCTWTCAIFPTTAIVRMLMSNFSREWDRPTTWWVGMTLLPRSPAGLSWMPCWKGRPSGAATCR